MQQQLETYEDTLSQFVTGIASKAADTIDSRYTNAADYLASIEDAITHGWTLPAETLDQYVAATNNQAYFKLQQDTATIINTTDSFDWTAQGDVRKQEETFSDYLLWLNNWLADHFKESAGDIADVVGGFIDKLPSEMASVITSIGAGFAMAFEPIIAPIQAVAGGISSIGASMKLLESFKGALDNMYQAQTSVSSLVETSQKQPIRSINQAAVSAVSAGAVVGAAVGAPLGFLPIVMDCYTAGLGENVRNVSRAIFKPTRMGIAELAISFVRGEIDESKLRHDSEELGFTFEDALQYVLLARQRLAAADIIALWLRKELTEAELDTKLAELAISTEDIAGLKKLAYYIPGVQDLIRMAVREAFTPEIAEKFGQYQDYPEALTEYAVKQGLSEDWAKRYWASHWELPGANMGFEMYWRKIISYDELTMLLRALDVMPYWRDRLIQLAYQPITRIDIRRMHKIGVLADNELQQRYEFLGYSPADAEMQARFTIELNKEEAKLEKQAERDLTAGEIISAYAGVYIDRESASAMLTELGYDDAEIQLKMVLADLPAIKRTKTARINLIRQRLQYGIIDINGAIDALNKLDLPPYEMEYQLLDMQLDVELQQIKDEVSPAKMLTSTEITSAYTKGIVDYDEASSLLGDLGFNDYQIGIKLALVAKKQVK